MRTKGNEPLISAPEPRLKRIPDARRVAKLDRQVLSCLQKLCTKKHPGAKQAVADAEALLEKMPEQQRKIVEDMIMSAKEVEKAFVEEIGALRRLVRKMSDCYAIWAKKYDGWEETARKLAVKHEVCFRKIGDVGKENS